MNDKYGREISYFRSFTSCSCCTLVHDVSEGSGGKKGGGASRRAQSLLRQRHSLPITLLSITAVRGETASQTYAPSSNVRLYIYSSGIMASKCPKCDKTVYFGECFNPSPARRFPHLLSSFVPFLSTDVIFFFIESCIISSEFKKTEQNM